MNKVIPDAAVEAALSVLFPKTGVSGPKRTTWTPTIRAILEAADPHMLAEPW